MAANTAPVCRDRANHSIIWETYRSKSLYRSTDVEHDLVLGEAHDQTPDGSPDDADDINPLATVDVCYAPERKQEAGDDEGEGGCEVLEQTLAHSV